MVKIDMNEVTPDLTPEELQELAAAVDKPPLFDEDSPEMTPEMLMQFKRMNKAERVKQTISLRLSPDTLKKAKSFGKGYTSVLSRLLDLAINDEEMLKKCL